MTSRIFGWYEDLFESRLLEILDNDFINVYKTSHLSKTFDKIRFWIPTPDVETEIKVSERKQVKFKSVNF